MHISFIAKSLIAFTLSAVITSAACAEDIVSFASLDGTTNLTAHLVRPPGNTQDDAPRPAIVMMHGCSGLLNKSGHIFPLYQAWMKALTEHGYVVLVVDSATSRGFGQTCSDTPNRSVMWRNRPRDAFAALQYLQAQPFVQADHVGLMGWSQGGGVVLRTINDKAPARPDGLVHDFKAAVAFYPAVCSDRLESKPFTPSEPQSWTTKTSMLVLFGEADSWTPFAPCQEFIEAVKARGSPVEIKGYPSAVHAFDAPNLPVTAEPQYRTGDGPTPMIGTNPEARADAFPRALEFLKAHLE